MTTAFALSRGGSFGAVQVGMLQALGERGITPDLLVGTSAGALNAVFVAGARDALCAGSGLQRLVRRHVPFAGLEDAPIPVHLVAVVQHYATEEQQRRVLAMATARTRDGRRLIWLAVDEAAA